MRLCAVHLEALLACYYRVDFPGPEDGPAEPAKKRLAQLETLGLVKPQGFTLGLVKPRADAPFYTTTPAGSKLVVKLVNAANDDSTPSKPEPDWTDRRGVEHRFSDESAVWLMNLLASDTIRLSPKQSRAAQRELDARGDALRAKTTFRAGNYVRHRAWGNGNAGLCSYKVHAVAGNMILVGRAMEWHPACDYEPAVEAI
jgi:hypothetical protein